MKYVVSGSVRVLGKVMNRKSFVIDTGSGHNAVRRDALSLSWRAYITIDRALLKLGDAS